MKRNLIDQNYIQRASKTVFKDACWQHQSTCASCTILWGLGEGGRGKANKQVRGNTSPPYPTQNHTKKIPKLRSEYKATSTVVIFASHRSVIGPEDLHHSRNKLYAKLQPITTWSRAFSRAFSRALGSLLDFTLNSHLLLKVFPFL